MKFKELLKLLKKTMNMWYNILNIRRYSEI